MNGFNVFYPFGTDDNGLATERLIEKLNNVKSKEMPRQEFINLCLKTLEKIRPEFIQDWKKLGMSCDFSIFYTTINKHSQKISQKSFIDLYKMDREYRKEAPTIYCPNCQTAIAQVELKGQELTSEFNDILFEVEGKVIKISTTRPELLPSCVAVIINPNDERYRDLIGKKVKVPLFNYKVPIIADNKVNPEKGTGIVMCCTFGDITDIDWYNAYNLPLRISINKDGTMNEIAKKYQGLSIKEAREQIINDLKENKLLTSQKHIKHVVNVHERCNTEVEFLITKQWFIKYLDLRKKFLKDGAKLNWYPKFMKNRLDNWIKGLKWDWCISRQRYFGVPFPVWYCAKCHETILADEKQLPVDPLKDKPLKKCPRCYGKEFIPEKDVLDTWATSSLTPIIAQELFKGKKVHNKLFPMSLRPQAHDIISFWLFNTLVKSQLHFNKNPWKDVAISGYVLYRGEKMSKSKGNIIEPQEIMNNYGADSLRFWAAS
ncbi:MAG: class I tRNA ligase family protein, partial [Nanoarchaeota archaeon]